MYLSLKQKAAEYLYALIVRKDQQSAKKTRCFFKHFAFPSVILFMQSEYYRQNCFVNFQKRIDCENVTVLNKIIFKLEIVKEYDFYSSLS